MAATVQIHRITGPISSPIASNITSTNTRANAEDAHSTAGTVNAIKIPPTGNRWSFWVTTRLFAATAPTGTIDNIRWHTDGVNMTGLGAPTGQVLGQSANTYVQAAGTTGTTGTQLTTGAHPGLTAAPVNVITFTTGAPKLLTGSITVPNTGYFGQFMIYQVQITALATAGLSGTETWTWRYDET